jgi:hypothetical protein
LRASSSLAHLCERVGQETVEGNPCLSTPVKVARALGVKVADLYEEIDEHTEALAPAA